MKNQTMKPLDLTGEWESVADANARRANRRARKRRDRIGALLLAELLLAAGIVVLWTLTVLFSLNRVACMIGSDVLALPACWIGGYLWREVRQDGK